jgi:hypothetical protein
MGVLNDYTNQDKITLNLVWERLDHSLGLPIDFKTTRDQEATLDYLKNLVGAVGDCATYVSDMREVLSRIDKKLPLVEKCIRAGYTEICTGYDHSDDREEDEEDHDDDYDDQPDDDGEY